VRATPTWTATSAACCASWRADPVAWKAYHLSPIDFGWEFLPTFQEVAARFAESDAMKIVHGGEYDIDDYPKLKKDLEFAKDLALEAGWEGDYRGSHTPRVLFLPDETEFICAFAWKQENNGSTFVVSPKPLPWLDDFNLI
jgi:hypothetical protein